MLIFFAILLSIFTFILDDNIVIMFMAEYIGGFYYSVCSMRDYTGEGCSPAILGRNMHFAIAFIAAFIITGNAYKDEIK